MKRSALFALAAILGSTAFANAFTVAPQNGASGIQLVQMKDEKMSKEDKMKHDKMMKEEKMKKDEMMKKDGMKK